MKNIFEAKYNKSIYFDKPQEFILVKQGAGQISLRKKETYAVWQKKRRISGKLVNVFYKVNIIEELITLISFIKLMMFV